MAFLRGLVKPFEKIGKGVTNLFRGGKNPADNARQFLQPIPGMGKEAYDPFIQQGREAFQSLKPQYEKLLNFPRESLEEDIAAYEPSSFYQEQLPYLLEAMSAQARGQGYSGTEYEQRRRADIAHQLLGADLGDYLNRVEGRRGLGMQGFETATGRGFQGAGSLADFLGNAAGNRANLEFAGKAQQGMNKSQFMGDIAKAIAAAFGASAGAGPGGKPQGAGGPTASKYGQSLGDIQSNIPSNPFGTFGGNISPGVGYNRGRRGF
jgi:hypothetical protein